MKNQAVLVVGSVNMDMVVKTNRFPQPGETVLGFEFGMFPGGKGANQAVCCAKLKTPTYFLGKMGKDIFMDKISENMKQAGVNLSYLLTDPTHPTGIALITVDSNGENEIVVASGSNMQLTPKDVDQSAKLFSSVSIVLIQLEIPLETVMRSAQLAKENGAVIILNPAPAQKLDYDLLKLVDYLTPNETELGILTGLSTNNMLEIETSARVLLSQGVKNVIVTLGENGALLVNNDTVKTYPTKKVQAVDTTAAGDAFNGSLAYSLSQGLEIDRAIQIANVVASTTVTKMGAQSSMPEYKDIAELINI